MNRTARNWAKAPVRIGRDILHETVRVSGILFRIMIPVVIVVKIMAELGVVRYIAAALRPVMGLVGLPGDMGIVWAAALLTTVYGGIIAFVALAPQTPLTVAQVTILASLMLVAHALPIELRVAQKAGARPLAMGLFRFGGALVLGGLLNLIYRQTGWLQHEHVLLWQPGAVDASLPAWVWDQIVNLAGIFAIILMLVTLMRLLRRLGVIGLLERMLAPVLRLLGMTPAATEITVVGMVLGLGYGSGLIIHHAGSGRIPKRDVLFSLALMGLCHSLIEDTLLMVALGAHLSGILLGRVLFALAATFALVKLSPLLPPRFSAYLYRR
ncbi:MAG: hypothetical protein JW993_15265 [Sedimentisphaerales bacterium]|nr:hypothetical protein [Sedimentisphaerales bacterium]